MICPCPGCTAHSIGQQGNKLLAKAPPQKGRLADQVIDRVQLPRGIDLVPIFQRAGIPAVIILAKADRLAAQPGNVVVQPAKTRRGGQLARQASCRCPHTTLTHGAGAAMFQARACPHLSGRCNVSFVCCMVSSFVATCCPVATANVPGKPLCGGTCHPLLCPVYPIVTPRANPRVLPRHVFNNLRP